MKTATFRDSNGRHRKTEIRVGPYKVLLHAHVSFALECSTKKPSMLTLMALEEYDTVGVRICKGSAFVGQAECKELVLGGRWDSRSRKWRKVPLDEALTLVGDLEVRYSRLYWRLPEWAGEGAQIDRYAGSDGTLSHVVVRLINGAEVILHGNRRMPCVPQEDSYSLDHYDQVAVRVLHHGEDLLWEPLQCSRVFGAGVPWPVYRMLPSQVEGLLKSLAAVRYP